MPFPRVKVGGQPVVTQSGPYTVAGCGLTGTSSPPCVTAQWVTAAVRVRAGSVPVSPAGQPVRVRSFRRETERHCNPAAGEGNMMQIDYPLHIDSSGRTATGDQEDHIRDMIEQVLFTSPGERVNRPDFGSGILNLLFGANNAEMVTATQFLVRGSTAAMARGTHPGGERERGERGVHYPCYRCLYRKNKPAAAGSPIQQGDLGWPCSSGVKKGSGGCRFRTIPC